MPSYKNDYRYYVPRENDDLTAVGEKYLNESIEAYCYSILGAQAWTRIIILTLTMAQLVRRHRTFIASFVEDTIIQTSVTVSISNMHAKGDK